MVTGFNKFPQQAFLIVIFLFFVLLTQAQRPRCHTMEYQQFLLSEIPELILAKQSFDSTLKERIKSNYKTEGPVIKIPIVVHLIGDNAIAIVTIAKINEEISILNQDYRKIVGSNGDGAGVDTKIEFCLALYDPLGLPTSGIVPTSGTFTEWDHNAASADPNSDLSLKTISHWPPREYLN